MPILPIAMLVSLYLGNRIEEAGRPPMGSIRALTINRLSKLSCWFGDTNVEKEKCTPRRMIVVSM